MLLGLALAGAALLTGCDRAAKDAPGGNVRPASSAESAQSAQSDATGESEPVAPEVFDQRLMESDVARILAEDYGQAGVSGVRCPPEQSAEAGREFTCEVVIDGEAHGVPIRVRDGQRYEVGVPDGIEPP